MSSPAFSQLNLVVSNMAAAMVFWRRLGLTPETSPDGAHARAQLSGDLVIEWDTTEFAKVWDAGCRGPARGGIIVGFEVPSRQAVDDLYDELTAAGYHGHQRPYDAFWGVRYAIVDDPDGNAAGLMSPVEASHKSWPPNQAPGA